MGSCFCVLYWSASRKLLFPGTITMDGQKRAKDPYRSLSQPTMSLTIGDDLEVQV